jgi:hypothetical protein
VSLLSLSRRVNLLVRDGTPTLLLNFTSPPERKFTEVKLGSGVGSAYLSASRKLAARKWQHLAVTCRPEGKGLLARLYLDGEVVAEGVYAGTFDKGASALTLGCDPYQRGDSRAFGTFRGVQLYRRALDGEEVRKVAADHSAQ